MSADPEQEYFADGIAEDILTPLAIVFHFVPNGGNKHFSSNSDNFERKSRSASVWRSLVMISMSCFLVM